MVCASARLVIGLGHQSSLTLHRLTLAQSILKRALQQHTDDMFFIFLRAVQITDRLRGTPRDCAGLLRCLLSPHRCFCP